MENKIDTARTRCRVNQTLSEHALDLPCRLFHHRWQHEERQPTFEEMQEKFREDWKNANFEEDIFYKDYVDLRMRYSGGRN